MYQTTRHVLDLIEARDVETLFQVFFQPQVCACMGPRRRPGSEISEPMCSCAMLHSEIERLLKIADLAQLKIERIQNPKPAPSPFDGRVTLRPIPIMEAVKRGMLPGKERVRRKITGE